MLLAVVDKEERAAAYVAKPSLEKRRREKKKEYMNQNRSLIRSFCLRYLIYDDASCCVTYHTVRKLLWLRLTKLPLAEDMVLHMERASHDCTER